jgi:flagellar capping protein FliD
MTGTISFGGIGSGIDTEGIVTGLVNANSVALDRINARITQASQAATSISELVL